LDLNECAGLAGRDQGELMLVAEFGGPSMFARSGVMRALNRHHVREFNPGRKDPILGRML
jgi:hypothetical protein